MDKHKQHNGNVGKGKRSYEKHYLIKRAAGGQVSILAKNNTTDRGVIIDMHAGDGDGGTLPQLSLWEEALSDASPFIANRLANTVYPTPDIILCESHVASRHQLDECFRNQRNVRILPNNHSLLKLDFSQYSWGLVLNDPNGPRDHSVDVLEFLSRSINYIDFIIVVNEGGIERHLGLRDHPLGDSKNATMIRQAYETRERYKWMLDPDQWRIKLGRKKVAWSTSPVINSAFRGRVIVAANFLSQVFSRGQEWQTN